MSNLLNALRDKVLDLHTRYMEAKTSFEKEEIMTDLRIAFVVMCDGAQEDPDFFYPLPEVARLSVDSMEDAEFLAFLAIWSFHVEPWRGVDRSARAGNEDADVRRVLDSLRDPPEVEALREERRQTALSRHLNEVDRQREILRQMGVSTDLNSD